MSTSTRRAAPAARRRRRWTAAEKTACPRAFDTGGQSVAAFCHERGVPRATLTLWRRTADALPASAPPTDAARFARVEVVAPPAPPEITGAPPPASVELTLALRAPDGLDAVVTGLDTVTAIAVRCSVPTPRTAGAA